MISHQFLSNKAHNLTKLGSGFNQVYEEQGQRCTPLLIAARNGKENVIKMLLSQFKPDIEQEGDVKFDGYLIEGASPLWCAAGIKVHYDILSK